VGDVYCVRAVEDYAAGEEDVVAGSVGVKVTVYEVFESPDANEIDRLAPRMNRSPGGPEVDKVFVDTVGKEVNGHALGEEVPGEFVIDPSLAVSGIDVVRNEGNAHVSGG